MTRYRLSDAERAILTEVDAMFTRSPQWFEIHLPTLHKMLNDRERAHVAAAIDPDPGKDDQ